MMILLHFCFLDTGAIYSIIANISGASPRKLPLHLAIPGWIQWKLRNYGSAKQSWQTYDMFGAMMMSNFCLKSGLDWRCMEVQKNHGRHVTCLEQWCCPASAWSLVWIAVVMQNCGGRRGEQDGHRVCPRHCKWPHCSLWESLHAPPPLPQGWLGWFSLKNARNTVMLPILLLLLPSTVEYLRISLHHFVLPWVLFRVYASAAHETLVFHLIQRTGQSPPPTLQVKALASFIQPLQ